MNGSVTDRRGFTLAELAVVVMTVGILSGLALPSLRSALLKAEASSVVADARTVSLAAYEYLGDNGTFPQGAAYGSVPAALEPHLPDNFEFEYKGMRYMWFGLTMPNPDNAWNSRTLGLFIVDYSQRPDMAAPFQAFQGGNGYWSSTLFYFIYTG